VKPYQIELLKTVRKELLKLSEDVQKRIVAKIDGLALDPPSLEEPFRTSRRSFRTGNSTTIGMDMERVITIANIAIADTGFIVALTDHQDLHHRSAKEYGLYNLSRADKVMGALNRLKALFCRH